MDQQCNSPFKNPCNNCEPRLPCCFKIHEEDDQCAFCLNTKNNNNDCYVRCTTCHVLTCISCNQTELYGFCIVCDREVLNRKKYCTYCNRYVKLITYQIYDCDRCEEAQGPYRYIDKIPCWNCSNKPNQ